MVAQLQHNANLTDLRQFELGQEAIGNRQQNFLPCLRAS